MAFRFNLQGDPAGQDGTQAEPGIIDRLRQLFDELVGQGTHHLSGSIQTDSGQQINLAHTPGNPEAGTEATTSVTEGVPGAPTGDTTAAAPEQPAPTEGPADGQAAPDVAGGDVTGQADG